MEGDELCDDGNDILGIVVIIFISKAMVAHRNANQNKVGIALQVYVKKYVATD